MLADGSRLAPAIAAAWTLDTCYSLLPIQKTLPSILDGRHVENREAFGNLVVQPFCKEFAPNRLSLGSPAQRPIDFRTDFDSHHSLFKSSTYFGHKENPALSDSSCQAEAKDCSDIA
eukprot:6235394-Amphidinium_carterae.1